MIARLSHKQTAELFLTVGRILKWTGYALAAVPVAAAIPGVVLLVAGRELYQQGEDAWNEIHNLPKRGF